MKKMKDSRTSSIVLHNLLIAVLAFIWLIPIIWLLCTSFSAYSGMNTSYIFPRMSISNYMKLFHSDSVSQFPQWFLNTFIIACFTCVISTMFVLMVAYATSVMRFKMRKTADEHGSYPESVSWYAGNDCSLLHTEIF